MPEQPKIYPLSSITKAIENVINKHAAKFFWVKAEIVKLNHYKQSGHCYPDLVEKADGKIVAEIRGNIWRDNFQNINKRFKEVLNEELGDDMTVVCYAKVNFSSVYGLSLNIIDINPEYTLGELAKQKAETIKKLKAENIYHLNKLKSLPRVPKTIAIISVETSKGYQDFINVINRNPWGYKFHHKLFPALLQGTRSVTTIMAQLKHIEKYKDVFDAVTIIRGGGGDIGLSSYDTYELAKTVATYPIPVLSGIGHSTNLTVTEMVSHQNFITPTKIAEYLIQKYHNFSVPLQDDIVVIKNYVKTLFEKNNTGIKDTARLFSSLTNNYLKDQKHQLSNQTTLIINTSQTVLSEQNNNLKEFVVSLKHMEDKTIQNEKTSLNEFRKYLNFNFRIILDKEKTNLTNLEKNINILSPVNILNRGFSITRLNGKSITNIDKLQTGDKIITQLASGQIDSEIKEINYGK